MSKTKETPEQPEKAEEAAEQEAQAGALVPLYGGAIVPGIQAFRRDDIILYTIRGEPKEVLELVGELDRQGVGEVVALISHPAQDEGAPEEPRSENRQG
ncbi:MAG: hypothetical protein KAX44_03670 [Candidatus Brocadiae bacterium]|nr:hypothetical protein [Candidatus Brocadiia bacterium]